MSSPDPKDENSEYSVAFRIKTCNSCEHLTKLKVCSKCGCFMPAKVRMKRAECPILLWKAIK
jgi:hypothetical protein